MATNAAIGFGTLFKVGNGAETEVFTTLGQQVEIPGFEISMDSVDATHMESTSGFREYIAGLGDAGEIPIVVHFVEDGTDVSSNFTQMKARTAKNYQLVFPGGAVFQCAGIVTNIAVSSPMDDKMTASFTFKMSGVPTFTAEA